MIWGYFLGLAALALLPLLFALVRPPRLRGRHDSDMALYRAQLAEVDRQREEGRLDDAQHRAATVEIQRRLLAMPGQVVAAASPMPRYMLASIFLIPAAALGLYVLRGTPDMPSVTHEERAALAARDDAVIGQLRARLQQLDPRQEQAWRGWLMLGNAERRRGRLDSAAAAWTTAIDARFDVGLALDFATLELERERPDAALALLRRVEAANPEADVRMRYLFLLGGAEEQAGHPAEARRAWQQIIDTSPPDAPWREMLQRRMDRLPQ